MEQVKTLLQNAITDSVSEIDRLIDDQYDINNRATHLKGSFWEAYNTNAVARLDRKRDKLEVFIVECKITLEWINNA
jgi:hypothetical protein